MWFIDVVCIAAYTDKEEMFSVLSMVIELEATGFEMDE